MAEHNPELQHALHDLDRELEVRRCFIRPEAPFWKLLTLPGFSRKGISQRKGKVHLYLASMGS